MPEPITYEIRLQAHHDTFRLLRDYHEMLVLAVREIEILTRATGADKNKELGPILKTLVQNTKDMEKRFPEALPELERLTLPLPPSGETQPTIGDAVNELREPGVPAAAPGPSGT